jgi:hypothetical protein
MPFCERFSFPLDVKAESDIKLARDRDTQTYTKERWVCLEMLMSSYFLYTRNFRMFHSLSGECRVALTSLNAHNPFCTICPMYAPPLRVSAMKNSFVARRGRRCAHTDEDNERRRSACKRLSRRASRETTHDAERIAPGALAS